MQAAAVDFACRKLTKRARQGRSEAAGFGKVCGIQRTSDNLAKQQRSDAKRLVEFASKLADLGMFVTNFVRDLRCLLGSTRGRILR